MGTLAQVRLASMAPGPPLICMFTNVWETEKRSSCTQPFKREIRIQNRSWNIANSFAFAYFKKNCLRALVGPFSTIICFCYNYSYELEILVGYYEFMICSAAADGI